MRTVRCVALVAFVAAACAGSPQASSPVPPSPSAAAQASLLPTPTAQPTPVVQPTPIAKPTVPPASHEPAAPTTPGATPTAAPAGCPTPSVLSVHEYATADPACFGAGDVTLIGWLGALPAMGWEAPHIEPAWLYYPPNITMSALWQRGPGGDEMCGDDDTDCAYRIVHLAPGSTIDLGETPRWVIATGHTGDPAAGTCHYILGEDWPAPTPSNEGARAECAEQFVLTSLRDAPSGPTSPAP